jgi:hypothetical protein
MIAVDNPLSPSFGHALMSSPIHHLTIIRYYRDRPGWDDEQIQSPPWHEVEAAIRRMDNYCYPIVQLNCTEFDDDEDIFNVIGGDGRWALFQMAGDWRYEDPAGGADDVRLWDSDQGYFCQQRHLITDVEKVLRITKAFYESGSCERLDEVE